MDIQKMLQQLKSQNSAPKQKEEKHSFKVKPIKMPNNLSKSEQNIADIFQKLFSCKLCFEFESKDRMPCGECEKIMKTHGKTLQQGIFEKENYFSDLNTFWKVGNNLKVYCGKILKATDVGFKCYDCEMDPTCIICKECFEKGNHQGHRTVVQKGCSGCCDCGDIEAWKKEGFCSEHKGFLTNEQLSINQINENNRNNCIKLFKLMFYYLFTSIENVIQQTENGEEIQQLQNNKSIQMVAFQIIVQIEGLSLKNPVLQNLFNHILCESYFEEDKYKFRHCCPDIVSRIQIGNLKTHPLAKCQCTILELLLRYVNAFSSDVQEKLKNFFISMFNLYHFKQNLIKGYTKMFNFFYYYKEINNGEDLIPVLSKFQDLSVQLFTSDILAGYVLEQKTEAYIIQHFQSMNQINLGKQDSCNAKNKQKQDKNKNLSEQVNQKQQAIRRSSRKSQRKQSEQEQNSNQTSNQREAIITEEEEQKIQSQVEEEQEISNNEESNNNEEDDEDNEDSYQTIEDESYTNSGSEYSNMVFDQSSFENAPLYDNLDDQQYQQRSDVVQEYYFGNILDKLLLFANYSFQNQHAINEFLQAFQHINYISQKSFSLSKLIQKDLFRTKFIEILSKLHFKMNNNLKREFVTIHKEDEYALNGLYCESEVHKIIQKIICYLHTDNSVDAILFQKIHIDYLKNIIKKIYETTEKYHNKQLSNMSSIHIPLHRALITFIMSYFKFDFEQITPQSVSKLAGHLKLQFEDFKIFFFEQLKFPLSTVSFIKEIDCGVWNFHGEYFKEQTLAYISSDIGSCYEDTLFLQFALKIGSIDLHQLANMFCNKKEFLDIVNLKLVKKNTKSSKDFLEKNEKVVGEFLSFIIYTLMDQVALFNLTKSIFQENPDKLKSFMKYTNMFMSSYMHQFKTASIQDVQKSLTKVFSKNVDISELLLKVSTFNNSTKKFQIIEKFGNLCEPYLFYWCPEIKSVYHDKIFEKYSNTKDTHIYLLGNYEFSNLQKGILKNIINQKSFRFIEDLIRQPYISIQLENKKSIAQQYLILPILKLILIYSQNTKLYNNSNTIDSHAQNILTFLSQYKVNLGKEIADVIQLLQEKLNKSESLTIEKEQSNEGEDDKQKKKEQMQKRQEEILKQFKQRIQSYSEKNQEDLTLEKSISIGESCVICKKSLDDETEQGFGVYCQKTNIYEFSELKGYAQQVNMVNN